MAGARKIVLGSRGSELARAQTRAVEEALRAAWPKLEIRIEIIKTRGDEKSIEAIDRRAGRKGLFTAEIERALAAGEVDVAVHSAKDLPSETLPELEIRAVLPRADVEDVLVLKKSGGFDSLGQGSIIATGSVRRRQQLQWKKPEVVVVDLRGNVPTRLRKLAANENWNGIVLARAGLERLGLDLTREEFNFEGASFYREILPSDSFLPAGGQGVIALQVRSGDEETKSIVDAVNHAETLLCLRAEREFLRLLQGDCDSPVGVLATIKAGVMKVRAQVFEAGRAEPRQGEAEGSTEEDGETLGAALFREIAAGWETGIRNVQRPTSNVQRPTKKEEDEPCV